MDRHWKGKIMPVITLPDGSQREFENPVSVLDVANDIGAGLARATVAGKVNDNIVDASFVMSEDSQLAIITDKSDEGLEVIRHSAAHLLAQAVKELFPEAQVTIGPVIEDGFYYDFAYKEGFSETDLETIEKKMAELAKQDFQVERSVMTREDAIGFFADKGEAYKAELIESIPHGEELSLYKQGDFIDLCRGKPLNS
jgi:threonyl-tRNA synthetase